MVLSALALTPVTLPGDTVNIPYSQAITASGGIGPVTLTVTNLTAILNPPSQSGSLGLTVPLSGTGSLAISGTPTATGTETFTVTATDSENPPVQVIRNYVVTVNPVVSLNAAPLPADTQYVAYNQVITPTGGTNPTLAVSNIQNPIPGLTVPASKVGSLPISGTPTATGTESFTVTAIDSAGGPSAMANYSITVNPWVDPSGIVLTSMSGYDDGGSASFLDPKGNLVVAGVSTSQGLVYGKMAVVRYLPNGSLDTSFNGTGFTTTAGPSQGDYWAYCAADYPSSASDKIVVGGDFLPARGSIVWEFALTRYNANGSLDTTFGTKGEVVTDVGSSGQSHIRGVVVLPNGDIVAAGNATGGNGVQGFALACYTPAGKLDTTFKAATGDPVAFTTPKGIVTTAFGGVNQRVDSVAIQTVGTQTYIVAAGVATINGTDVAVLTRYNLNGSLDKTFGTNGVMMVQSVTSATSVIVDASGDIYVGGGGSGGMAVARYLPSGTLDTAFTNNVAAANVAGGVNSMAIQPQTGEIVASGARAPVALGYDTKYSNAVVRFNSDGTLDTSFGMAGFAVAPSSAPLRLLLNSVDIQSNGGIVITGTAQIPVESYVAVAQFSANGILNTSFGNPAGQVQSVSSSAGSSEAALALPLVQGAKLTASDGSADGSSGELVSIPISPVAAAPVGSPASTRRAEMLPLSSVSSQPVGVTGTQKLPAHRGGTLRGLAVWSVDRALAELSALDLKIDLLAEEVAF